MTKRNLVLLVIVIASSFVAFQNCSGGLPGDVNSTPPAQQSTDAITGCSLDGNTVPSGTAQMGYTEASADNDVCPSQQSLTCLNGLWYGTSPAASSGIVTGSGSSVVETTYVNAYSSCQSIDLSCSVVGTTVASGASIPAFTASSVPYGSSCGSVQGTLSCNNGVVSASSGAVSSYVATSCTVAAAVPSQTGQWHFNLYASNPTFLTGGLCPAAVASGDVPCTPGSTCYSGNYSDIGYAVYACY